MMRFKAKSLLFLCVLMSISLFGINVRAANPADFRAIYTPYINQHEAAFVIDLDNDGVPELLGLDSKEDGWVVLGWVYSINNNGTVSRYRPTDFGLMGGYQHLGISFGDWAIEYYGGDCLYNYGGIDGSIFAAFYVDPHGRIYCNSTGNEYTLFDVGCGWKYHSVLYMQVNGERVTLSNNYNQHIFEYSYNNITWEEYKNEEQLFMDPYYYAYVNEIRPLFSIISNMSIFTYHEAYKNDFMWRDPWSTWVSPAVVINGELLRFSDAKPYIECESNRTMIPMRAIFENLGASVSWNDAERKITARKGNKEIIMKVGERVMYVNGQARYLDTSVEIPYGGRTFVPLRAVSEALGAIVEWDDSNKVVYIAN